MKEVQIYQADVREEGIGRIKEGREFGPLALWDGAGWVIGRWDGEAWCDSEGFLLTPSIACLLPDLREPSQGLQQGQEPPLNWPFRQQLEVFRLTVALPLIWILAFLADLC